MGIDYRPVQQQQTPHVPAAEATPIKGRAIKITDPESGKNVTSEILRNNSSEITKRNVGFPFTEFQGSFFLH